MALFVLVDAVRWCLGGGHGLDTVECRERDVGPEGAGMLDGFTRASRRNKRLHFHVTNTIHSSFAKKNIVRFESGLA